MFRAFLRSWCRIPVTTLFVAVAVGLFVAVHLYAARHDTHTGDARWKLGAAVELTITRTGGSAGEQSRQISGFFDLWDGEWWRALATAFHHGDIIHLVLNVLSIYVLGLLLEPRMRRVWYVVYLLLATSISVLPDLFLEHTVVGLSGAAYAMFGTLMVIRRRDRIVAEFLTERVLQLGIGWLFVDILLTELEILSIANVAHFTGFAYGWLTGEVFYGAAREFRTARLGFCALHLALLPAFHYLTHPVWNGRYHWYLASQVDDLAEKVPHLREAVRRQPGLPFLWSELARTYVYQGERGAAWAAVLEGLSHNRSDDDGVALAREIWYRHMTQAERTAAMQQIEDVFGEEAAAWRQRLRVGPEYAFVANANAVPPVSEDRSGGTLRTFVVDPWAPQSLHPRDLHAPSVDPDHPTSAVAGERL